MTKTFSEYTNISINILNYLDEPLPVINNALAVFDEVLKTHDLQYDNVLFVGFSVWCFSKRFKKVFITGLTDEASAFLRKHNIDFTHLSHEDLVNGEEAFECVVAIDELTTFVNSEAEQRALISLLCDCTDKLLITTLRDYKNADFKEKEFSSPEPIRCCKDINCTTAKIITEFHNYNFVPTDRYTWKCKVYELTGEEMIYHGGFMRRAMFFKQLAKFTADVGSKKFSVHKASMYKSLSRRDTEFIIMVEF